VFVLCGPNRPPFSQKSLYGTSGGGTGVGKIDASFGLVGSLMSTMPTRYIGPVQARGPVGVSAPPVPSECTNTNGLPGMGMASCTCIPPNGGSKAREPINFGFAISLISSITNQGL